MSKNQPEQKDERYKEAHKQATLIVRLMSRYDLNADPFMDIPLNNILNTFTPPPGINGTRITNTKPQKLTPAEQERRRQIDTIVNAISDKKQGNRGKELTADEILSVVATKVPDLKQLIDAQPREKEIKAIQKAAVVAQRAEEQKQRAQAQLMQITNTAVEYIISEVSAAEEQGRKPTEQEYNTILTRACQYIVGDTKDLNEIKHPPNPAATTLTQDLKQKLGPIPKIKGPGFRETILNAIGVTAWATKLAEEREKRNDIKKQSLADKMRFSFEGQTSTTSKVGTAAPTSPTKTTQQPTTGRV